MFPKIYFVDFNVHTPEEIAVNISKLNEHRDAIVVRKCTEEFAGVTSNILKNSQIKTISHFENKIRGDFTHYASSKRPSKCLTRNVRFARKSISFHGVKDLRRLLIIKPQIIFLSPVFKTKTHPEVKHLGKIRTFKIASEIKRQSPYSQIFLLGNMNHKNFMQIKKLDSENLITGYAFIRGI